jgi:hypothetical protein
VLRLLPLQVAQGGGVMFVHPTVSDLVFSGTLTRYPDIQWIFTRGGGALPLLADRMDLSRFLFQSDVSGPSVQDQIHRLWFDMAGSPLPQPDPGIAGHGNGVT